MSTIALIVSLSIGYGVARTQFEDVKMHISETQKSMKDFGKTLNELRITVAALTVDLKNLREEIKAK